MRKCVNNTTIATTSGENNSEDKTAALISHYMYLGTLL